VSRRNVSTSRRAGSWLIERPRVVARNVS
jgi:hypothetical protein